jgi:hypothetical protein
VPPDTQAFAWTLPVSYAVLRRRWCAAALRQFLRRWGVYGLIVSAAFGAGMPGGPLEALLAVGSLAAWTVLPLAWAVSRWSWGWPALLWAPLAWILQMLVGALIVRALRPWLWPLAWRDAEAALPMPAAARWRSDMAVAATALLPWWALQALGLANLWGHHTPWFDPGRHATGLLLLLAQGLAWGWGVLGLQQARRFKLERPQRSITPATSVAWSRPLRWWTALLWMPMWRGSERALGVWWAGGMLALLGPAAAILWQPHWLPGAFAVWSVGAFALVPRLGVLSRAGLLPLLQEAAAGLPLAAATLERARRTLVLLPVGLTAVGMLLAAMFTSHDGLRPLVLLAWAGLAMLSLWWLSSRPLAADGAAVRWLLCLVMLLALSSEMF